MFSKFSSIWHQAVEALAPNLPLQQDFISHWRAVTNYFISNKDHKVSVDQTSIPGHLNQMVELLVQEEAEHESGATGPCMEFLLQHRILETLYTLARTDTPPGMKQKVLIFYTKLFSRVRHPLLPHVNVHKSIQRVVRLCGEVQAGPTESEEIQFLCVVCGKLQTDPYLVNFFIDVPKTLRTNNTQPNANCSQTRKPAYILVNSLLNLVHSPDARVGVKACEGLMLCASLGEQTSAEAIVNYSSFCQEISQQLCILYSKLPKVMDPADIEMVEAKWGLDILSESEDYKNFAGKRPFISFLSWLDYCDQLIQIAHPLVAKVLSSCIRKQFLEAVLEPAILQASERGAITATSQLTRCLRLVFSQSLLTEFVTFILGDGIAPEVRGLGGPPLRDRLIERCDHLSEELTIISFKVFDTLLLKCNELAVHNLILRNLLGRSYTTAEDLALHNNQDESGDRESKPVNSDNHDDTDNECSTKTVEDGCTDCDKNQSTDSTSQELDSVDDVKHEADVPVTDVKEVGFTGGTDEVSKSAADTASESSCPSNLSTPEHHENGPRVHTIVNSYFRLLPEVCKSSSAGGDCGYDTYLRDAHKQFADMNSQCLSFKWPTETVCDVAYQTANFYEGAFLKILLDKISQMLDQSYDVNLQVTCVISRMALLPHPNLHEFLLNPFLPVKPGCRTLTTVLNKLSHDIEVRMQKTQDFHTKLQAVRHDLMGFSSSYRSIEDNNMLAGVIVLEEFCKELAAIAFVKHHTVADQIS